MVASGPEARAERTATSARPWVARISFSAMAKVWAEIGRWAGSLLSAISSSAARSSGTPACRMSGYGSVITRRITDTVDSSGAIAKGSTPVRQVASTLAREYTSPSGVGAPPSKTSGAVWA